MIYFDTSYLARLYIDDHGFTEVRSLAANQRVAAAVLGRVETMAALHRAYRERRSSEQVFRQQVRQFQDDCAQDAFTWLPLTSRVFERAEEIYLHAPANVFLRAADALHLASAREYGFGEIYSNDRHLLAAAPLFGIKGVNLILPSRVPLTK
ncbi:MAG: type II toxin-antitoxin system VapC family toxin [Candidatus Binatia bacterium]